jgi:TrmH family RNA methyltransferase
MLEISSRNNPLIKEIRGLNRRKNRWDNKLFVIEGIKIVKEAMLSEVNIKQIIYSEKLLSTPEGQELFQNIQSRDNIVKLTDNLFNEISDTDNPQGILAIVEFIERGFNDISNIKNPALLFLDRVQDPGNMGTIIRTGDAFNIDGIIIGEGCVDIYNPKVARSTMGSIFRVPIYVCEDSLDFLLNIKVQGIKVLATSLDGELLYNENLQESFICIIGNESRGVDPKIISIADGTIKIPMPGKAESLNAGVAASIIMYESMRCRK